MFGDPNPVVMAAWRFAASTSSARQLAPAWTAGATIQPLDAVTVTTTSPNGISNQVLYVNVGSVGVTGSTAPTGTGKSASLDGTVQWVGYPTKSWRSLQVVNDDASNKATIGDQYAQVVPCPSSDGSAGNFATGLGVAPFGVDPTTIYALASSGAPSLVVMALS